MSVQGGGRGDADAIDDQRTGSALDRPAQFLKGVGPKRAAVLSRLGIDTARDLLYHTPRRYEDASTVTRIGSAQVGTDVTVVGEVVSKGVIPTRPGLRIFQAVLRDASGMIECSWPGQPFLERAVRKGDLLLVSGPVRFFRGRQIQPREFVVLGRADEAGAEGKVLPIYPATEGLSQRMMRRIVAENLDALLADADADEVLDAATLRSAQLPRLRDALEALHRPESLAAAEAGRRRLAFDEIFFLQLLQARAHRRATEEAGGIAFRRTDERVGSLYRALSFELTAAQKDAVREIFEDMTSPRRMNRMLEGDVGSGKTVVALFAMLLAADSGWQSALMAPTEILAEQHARTLEALLADVRPTTRVVLLTGRMGAAERRAALKAIETGFADIAVGTHALIQESVTFARLGLAVVDEQHRFGVRQRAALGETGGAAGASPGAPAPVPDLLVMSATPIPRTLALTLYGELDLSVLDERPAGRRPIRTAIRYHEARDRVYAFIREQVALGRQAYVVYPLVSESEKVDLRAATAEHERLASEIFPDLRVGLLHGQLAGDEKNAAMQAFGRGEVDVLVATSVIEVGIDVPNATVMVVEHAERFGLSQLHQLRGRVGRGGEQSYCVLIAAGGPDAIERLRVLADSDDGFEIARADLRLRGMGDFFGERQHGLPTFRWFDPVRDERLLEIARDAARRIVGVDPELRRHPAVRARLEERFGDAAKLYEVG